MAKRLALVSSILWLCAGCSEASGTPLLGGEAGVAPGGGSGGASGAGASVGTGSPGAGASVHIAACEDDNPAGLDRASRELLREGGDPGALRFLYPYDGTVFPRGLEAPVLMWDGGETAQAAYLHIYASDFAYEGCVTPDSEGRFALPQDVWERAAAVTGGKADPFQIELTLLHDGAARGPIRQELVIAPGSLKGSIYYNSYSSSLAKEQGAAGGAVLRIPPGGTAELFVGQRACAGCHSASADGSRLVTNEGVYALTPDTAPDPDPLRGANVEFPGISPDGDVYVFGGMLTETDTGTILPASGLPLPANELSFSPDGRLATFIDGPVNTHGGGVPVNIPWLDDLLGAVNSQGGQDGQGQLAVMAYDESARSFDDYRLFDQVSAAAQWPAITPDNQAILYTDTASNDLMILDLDDGESTLLARAMGFRSLQDAADGRSYLPFASQGEARQAYFPVLAPVAVGGYFWVIFDSPRRYGNFNTSKLDSGLAIPGGIAAALPIELPGVDGALASKQLWVAAIEVAPDGNYGVDRSAPAFYLPGQEMGANNHRAFAALDPCLEAGNTCSSGTECCSGFCGDSQCEPPADRCAGIEEACDGNEDCCDDTHACINGFCSLVNLI